MIAKTTAAIAIRAPTNGKIRRAVMIISLDFFNENKNVWIYNMKWPMSNDDMWKMIPAFFFSLHKIESIEKEKEKKNESSAFEQFYFKYSVEHVAGEYVDNIPEKRKIHSLARSCTDIK